MCGTRLKALLAPRQSFWRELGCVLTFVGILGVLLFPLLNRLRDNNSGLFCGINLQHLGVGMMQYAQDYDQHLPLAWHGEGGAGRTGGWIGYGHSRTEPAPYGTLSDYAGDASRWRCGSDRSRQPCSYGVNRLLFPTEVGPDQLAGADLRRVIEPSAVILACERDSGPRVADGCFDPATEQPARWHLRYQVFAFADGHMAQPRTGQVHYPNPRARSRFEPW